MLLIPVFVFFFLLDTPYHEWVAAFFFLLLSFTDYLDGYIARKKKQVTNIGKILDPIADKFLIITALLLLLGEGVAVWIVLIIIFREVLLTAIRLYIMRKGVVVAASLLGQAKTVSQMTAITGAILHLPSTEFLVDFLLYVAVVLTVVSGVVYLVKIRRYFTQGTKRIS